MTVINIYSKRQRKIRDEVNDAYQYNNISHALRVQIIKIVTDSIGFLSSNERYTPYRNEADKIYAYIHEILSKEYGVSSLKEFTENDLDALVDFFLKERNTEKYLDFIEIYFQILVNHAVKNHYEFKDIASQSPGDATIELGEKFREHGVGYQFESGGIIRVDSQLIRANVIKPTLILLSGEPLFEDADDEFLTAHERYGHKRYKECLDGCLKSFESIVKAIHGKNNWRYSLNDAASRLVNSCLSQNLIPAYLQSQFTSLGTMLETGTPTIRNKNAGHRRGVDIKEVPGELASCMLHLTATNLLFLLGCERSIK